MRHRRFRRRRLSIGNGCYFWLPGTRSFLAFSEVVKRRRMIKSKGRQLGGGSGIEDWEEEEARDRAGWYVKINDWREGSIQKGA